MQVFADAEVDAALDIDADVKVRAVCCTDRRLSRLSMLHVARAAHGTQRFAFVRDPSHCGMPQGAWLRAARMGANGALACDGGMVR